jgi:hypothetical protein
LGLSRTHLTCPEHEHPESGRGRESSKYSTEEFVELKYLCFGAITA